MIKLYRSPDNTTIGNGGGTNTDSQSTNTEVKEINFDSVFNSLDDSAKEIINKEFGARLHKANQEAKNLRTGKKSSEETLAKIKARFETDEITDELLDQLQKMPIEKLSAEEKAKQYERKLKERETELEKYKGELTTTKKSISEKSRDDEIIKELGKIGIRPDAMDSARKLLSIESNIDEDGTWKYNEKPLTEYISEWAKNNAYMLSNPTRAGMGSKEQLQRSNSITDFSKEAVELMDNETRRKYSNEIRNAIKNKIGW